MKNKILPAGLIFLLMITCSLPAQSFQHFLQRVNSTPDSLKTAIVDSFITAVNQFPYIEGDTLAHFIYRGNGNSVTVPGDANNWDPQAFPAQQLSGTHFFYYSRAFEPDARLDYKFVLNGTNWILDPRNPYQVSGGFGPNSELRMPDYVPPPEILPQPGISHGTIIDTTFHSAAMGNSRQVRVYLPPGYSASSDSFPVVLFHDGLDYLNLGYARNVLDYLIDQQRIQPLIAVFVPPVNRTREYAGDQMAVFSEFIVNDIMAWMDTHFRTRQAPIFRAVMGSSNGGNISIYQGLHYSAEFGNVAAQSSNVEPDLNTAFQNSPALDLRFYLDIGTYDIPLLIPRVQNFVQVLQNKGYDYEYQIWHQGHSWGNWRAHMDNALEKFFPGNATGLR
ncbi:MAG: alpha/beta hydrolase-fold protein, partial [Calditrichia bacterium]